MRLISILPDLKDQVGHILDYHLALKRAVEKSPMHHSAWVPKNCALSLPENWEKMLPPPRGKSFFHQIFSFFTRVRIYFSAIKKIDQAILFLEHFRITDLAELFLALLVAKGDFQVWLLHRYSPQQMKKEGKLHALFYRLFGRRIKLQFFTDSDLLRKEQQILFQKNVTLLPIPHGQPKTNRRFKKDSHLIYCWWPGGATRASKGLDHIIALSKLLENKQSPIRLIVAQNALSKGVVLSPQLIAIDDSLNRKDYDMWMNTIDIALLPYDPEVYHSSTSGIFVEAISAGKIPLIYPGTWMEYEAKKYGLEALAIRWDNLSEIEAISKNDSVLRKLKNMQKDYTSFHSEESFRNSLVGSFSK